MKQVKRKNSIQKSRAILPSCHADAQSFHLFAFHPLCGNEELNDIQSYIQGKLSASFGLSSRIIHDLWEGVDGFVGMGWTGTCAIHNDKGFCVFRRYIWDRSVEYGYLYHESLKTNGTYFLKRAVAQGYLTAVRLPTYSNPTSNNVIYNRSRNYSRLTKTCADDCRKAWRQVETQIHTRGDRKERDRSCSSKPYIHISPSCVGPLDNNERSCSCTRLNNNKADAEAEEQKADLRLSHVT